MIFNFLYKKDYKPIFKNLNHIIIKNNNVIIHKTNNQNKLFYDLFITNNAYLVNQYAKKYPSSLFLLLSKKNYTKIPNNVFIINKSFKDNFYINFNNINNLLKKIKESNFKKVILRLNKTRSLKNINKTLDIIGFKLYILKKNNNNKKIKFLNNYKKHIVKKNNHISGFKFNTKNKIYYFKSFWSKNSQNDYKIIKEFYFEIKKLFHKKNKKEKIIINTNAGSKLLSLHEMEIFLGDHIGEGLFIINLDGKITFHNKMFEKMFNFDNDINLSKIQEYFSTSRIKDLLNRWKFNKDPIIADLEINNNYEIRNFNITLSPIIEKNNLDLICAIIRDITLQKKIEHELKISNLKASLMNNKLISVQNAIIHGFSKLSEYKDKETSSHLERIQNYVKVIAYELYKREIFLDFKNNKDNYLSENYIDEISISSLLHDIGKVGIPDNILLKPDRLTKREYEQMQLHTNIGGDTLKCMDEIVGEISILALAKDIAYYHHERWNGTGYPFGLKKTQIPLCARIVSVCDVYDALTTNRPYKKSYSHEKACDIIYDSAESQFDPLVVSIFSSIEKQFKQIRNKYAN